MDFVRRADRSPDREAEVWDHFGHLASADGADLREDKMTNPAPDFWPIFGPLEPTAGPGSHGTGSGSKTSPGCTNNQPRRPILRPVRGYFVFLVPPARIGGPLAGTLTI